MVMMSAVSTPTSARVAFSTPFVIRAELPSSRQASATSNTTRPQAMRPIASPVPVRPPSRSSASSEGREARSAAGRPASSVDRSAAPTAKAATRKSIS